MEEVWKPVIGYEGLYEASSEGRIRSVDREIVYNNGRVHIHNGKMLKPCMTKWGYLQVMLCKEGKIRMFLIHRLVWMTFCGEIPDEMQVNHLDENKANNRLENLNLMTCKENINFGTRTERMAKANINNPLRSKPVIAIDEDGNVAFQFPSIKEAGRNGFDLRNLCACCRGKRRTYRGYRWKYLEDA